MGKYFGTDGFRGEAGITLTADHAYKVGRFLGWYYNALRERNGDTDPARIVIGKDTRRSSYMFEYSLVAGLTASGADAYLLHVTTTPSVAYIARVDDFDCGIMISASHNPYYDNGIKLIDCYGEKMPEETLLLVEDYIDGKLHVFDKDWPELPFARREHIGCTVDYVAGRNRYMGYASTGDGILTSLKMMEVMLAKKKPMSELAAPLKIYPQVLENVRVTDKKAAQNDPAVQEAVNKVAETLGDTGRILVRESGTEPVVRVMVEAPDHDTCQKYVDEVVNVICEKGYKA